MDNTHRGLASQLSFEERKRMEATLDVLLEDLYGAIHDSWDFYRQFKLELDTILYGGPRSL